MQHTVQTMMTEGVLQYTGIIVVGTSGFIIVHCRVSPPHLIDGGIRMYDSRSACLSV
jgi:hypothetical protein